MKLDTGWVTFASAGEDFPAYFARPPGATPGMPALVIIHEAFGVEAYIEDAQCPVQDRLFLIGGRVVPADGNEGDDPGQAPAVGVERTIRGAEIRISDGRSLDHQLAVHRR